MHIAQEGRVGEKPHPTNNQITPYNIFLTGAGNYYLVLRILGLNQLQYLAI